MEQIQVLKDHRKEIEFWLNALSNPNVDKENITRLNKCLQMELHQFLYPVVMLKTE